MEAIRFHPNQQLLYNDIYYKISPGNNYIIKLISSELLIYGCIKDYKIESKLSPENLKQQIPYLDYANSTTEAILLLPFVALHLNPESSRSPAPIYSAGARGVDCNSRAITSVLRLQLCSRGKIQALLASFLLSFYYRAFSG